MSSNTNTQQLEGKVDKNTFVKWFLTTDEKWTHAVDFRRLIPMDKRLVVKFKNKIAVTITVEEDDRSYDVTNTRRSFITASEREYEEEHEAECNICMHSATQSANTLRLQCGRCTFNICLSCQRKIVEKKGWLQCPACKNTLWGQKWFVDLINKGQIDQSFECKPNNVFIQNFDEEMHLQRWMKVKRNLLELVSMFPEFRNVPLDPFVDYVMSDSYDTVSQMCDLKKGEELKESAILIYKTLTTLYPRFQRKVKRPIRFRKPEPDRFEPQTVDDILNLAQRIFS